MPQQNSKVAAAHPFLPTGVPDTGWPFIRNSTFDGHSKEIHIADSWPEEGPPVLWTRELGQGYSAFVAKGKRVFTQAQSLAGQVVLCLDADTGETIWKHRYDLPFEPLLPYPGPRATPTLDGRYVYYAAPDGLIGCLEQSSGDEIWSLNVVEKYAGEGIEFGYSCSPTIVEGMLILPVGGTGASLVAINAKTGKEVWRSGNDPASYTPAYPISIGHRKAIVGYLQNSLILCDQKTGDILARMSLSQGYDEHSAWPLYQETHLWISGPFRSGSELLEITPTKESDKSELRFQFNKVWKSRDLSNDVSSSVLVDGHIYGFDIFDAQSKTQRPSRGKFRCVNFLTGETTWEIGTGRPRRLNSTRPADAKPEIGQSGIVVADEKLIILNEMGELILVRVNSERYEELARTSVLAGELTWTPPILYRGRVYIRNQTRAVCVFVGELDRLETETPLMTVADVPQSEYTDWAATLLAIEPEYAFDIPSDEWLDRWLIAGLRSLLVGSLLGLSLKWWFPCVNSHCVCLLVAATLGALGTTLLSRATGEFYFTWQLVVFASFEPLGSTLRLRKLQRGDRFVGAVPPSKWNERLRWVLFLAVSATFFYLCLRLSLVFEWAYLAGFAGAAPFCWLSARLANRQGTWNEPVRHLLRLVGFLAFSLVAAGVLATRYR
ncbi:MAG: PQQ-binding-like beta-propeller repeat protein [Planctomycetes bacterium]|nr:PQQ-binding-like beta-propeller repeat protein [Planctomycetota bacterium]